MSGDAAAMELAALVAPAASALEAWRARGRAGGGPGVSARGGEDDGSGAQPSHVVYGGADRFRSGLARKLGALALEALETYAPDAATFGAVFELDSVQRAAEVRERVARKLAAEPVEDLRVDFEDGYGFRPDDEEDRDARAVGALLATELATGALPPRCGVRVKALTPESGVRAARTLDLVLGALAAGARAAGLGARLPGGFCVTLPKVEVPAQVAALAALVERLEARHGLPARGVALELMVETPGALFDAEGRLAPGALVDAGAGRVRGVHFGTYDFTASLDIVAAHQRPDHPACDLARAALQLALAPRGVWLSDGATTRLPIAPHRPAPGATLAEAQRAENAAAVRGAWAEHATNIRRALAAGYYQGWDLHPAQLVARFAATQAFFLAGEADATRRLANFLRVAGQATRVGAAFDDAATGQGLLNFFLRASACGALGDGALAAAGLTPAELATRSFAVIVEGRRAAAGARSAGE